MATKIKKSTRSSKKVPAKKSFFKNRIAILFTLFVVVGLGAWGLMRSLAVPSDINLVGTEVSTQKMVTDANGCYYQPVQCVKAPCEPIKVCPTTTTSNTIPSGCTSWFDGCNTCTVKNGVIAGCTKMACKLDPNNPPRPYCKAYGEDTPVPVPTSVPEPVICAQDMYACAGGAMVRRTGPRCEFVCPSSTPASSPIPSPSPVTRPSPSIGPAQPGIATFTAIKPCANNSFLSINFTCKDGRIKNIASGICTNLVSAIKAAESSCNEVSQ